LSEGSIVEQNDNNGIPPQLSKPISVIEQMLDSDSLGLSKVMIPKLFG
jgi:hypothetical protein